MEDRLLAPVPAREAPFRVPVLGRPSEADWSGAREGPGLRAGEWRAADPRPGAAEAAALPRPRPRPAPPSASLSSTLPAPEPQSTPHPCVVFGFPANPRWPSQPLAPIFNLFNEISFPVIPETGNL